MSTDTVTNGGIVECGLGEPWGNFDGTKGVMPIAELEQHLEAIVVPEELWQGLKELEIDLNCPTLPLAFI